MGGGGGGGGREEVEERRWKRGGGGEEAEERRWRRRRTMLGERRGFRRNFEDLHPKTSRTISKNYNIHPKLSLHIRLLSTQPERYGT